MMILRHNAKNKINTQLDPIEDMLNFMTSLKSKGFTNDILKYQHNFTQKKEINITSQLISLYIDNAIKLAEQGLGGPTNISFLSLYYSALNFIKIHLLFLGKRLELEKNRWHGARYNENEMYRDFLNEKIQIKSNGTIPLFYNTLFNKIIPNKGIEITLEEIYSSILSINAEYGIITKKNPGFIFHDIFILEDNQNGHHLRINLIEDQYISNPAPSPRQLKAFSSIKLIQSANQYPYYISKKFPGNFNNIKPKLINLINRNLISDYCTPNNQYTRWMTLSPINGKTHILNEELSILIAYFHLSNVIRYNPEHFAKLIDSKYWTIILSLRKQGFLRFLKLMWGNINKTSFDI